MQTPLSPGTKLGRYEIRSQLGSGGMGEVYLAWDSQLDRNVAIKVLPESLTFDQQRLRRFVLEAKAASALNHPHILTIHEIGTAGSTPFIASEFIEGETLRPANQPADEAVGCVGGCNSGCYGTLRCALCRDHPSRHQA
jgi:serine/threonine protein kinase